MTIPQSTGACDQQRRFIFASRRTRDLVAILAVYEISRDVSSEFRKISCSLVWREISPTQWRAITRDTIAGKIDKYASTFPWQQQHQH